jgi:hypothetical protein
MTTAQCKEAMASALIVIENRLYASGALFDADNLTTRNEAVCAWVLEAIAEKIERTA